MRMAWVIDKSILDFSHIDENYSDWEYLEKKGIEQKLKSEVCSLNWITSQKTFQPNLTLRVSGPWKLAKVYSST